MSDLPPSLDLFETFVRPWYPRDLPEAPLLRTDLEEIELPEGVHIRELHSLEPAERGEVLQQLATMTEAALEDLRALCGIEGELSPEDLARIEDHFSSELVLEVIRGSRPDELNNNWLVLSCELGAFVAWSLMRTQPRLQWLPAWPYWDSALFDLNTGLQIPVFHWAFKFMSGDEERSLGAKRDALFDLLTGGG